MANLAMILPLHDTRFAEAGSRTGNRWKRGAEWLSRTVASRRWLVGCWKTFPRDSKKRQFSIRWDDEDGVWIWIKFSAEFPAREWMKEGELSFALSIPLILGCVYITYKQVSESQKMCQISPWTSRPPPTHFSSFVSTWQAFAHRFEICIKCYAN